MKIDRRTGTAWLLAAVVLLIGAAGSRMVLQSFGRVFDKEKLPLRRSFETIPIETGNYRCREESRELPEAVQASLNADAHLTRLYRDRRFRPQEPGAWIRLHLAYYSGMTDTSVGHRPEICYTAAGAETVSGEQVRLRLGADGVEREIPATLFRYRRPGDERTESVVYFFLGNGKVFGTPLGVRLLDLNLDDRYSYWCKVEVQTIGVRRGPLARRVASEFLDAVLPAVEACMPAWPPDKHRAP
ncbi:exosortase-associated EpsI family protein [Kiritimatiella glycovorans]|uniref:EpsI family protein n=1 Tax=Kiritimatiella glycovorans TaxID=1307763 RepID=A0A0G3EH39_9BACT|nr:exosortase-associated EpsI family protein [Kiritimatiella glycovorans]AKJ65673.1 EpsI family protein [Kiritimatiella glycovorans]